jgi:hypothetical protein
MFVIEEVAIKYCPYSSTLAMVDVRSSDKSEDICHTRRHHVRENNDSLHSCRREHSYTCVPEAAG